MGGRLIVDISVSLDGFVTGPDPGPEHRLGVGGEPIHAWAAESEHSPVDAVVSPHAVHVVHRPHSHHGGADG